MVDAGTGPMMRAGGWHFGAWCIGAIEVWVILWVLGVPLGLAAALAIESLGMAARSLGFALPAGLGAQEAGLAAVAVALGVPFEGAVAMAMLKRMREVTLNLPGADRMAVAGAAAGAASHRLGPPRMKTRPGHDDTALSPGLATDGIRVCGPPRLAPHLARLEAEAIGILREAAAACRRPVLLYSIGKDLLRAAASGPEGLLPRPAAFPAAAHRHRLEVPGDDRLS
ncbi:hypothetical protein [Dankookia sp. P2]|uniref:hypothetical protein n=1 Tax=Dankookia sp. P2 TaxID=3423955 RepID=UPI003D67E2A5